MNIRRIAAMGAVLALIVGPSVDSKSPSEQEKVPCSPLGNLTIEALPGQVSIDEAQGQFVVVNGRWQSMTTSEITRIPVVNAVEITCYKVERTCTESIAMLYTELDKDVRREGYGNVLMVSTHQYQVREWTNTTVLAVEKPRAADIEIRISLEHKTAERTLRETGTRGAAGASPIPRRWTLN